MTLYQVCPQVVSTETVVTTVGWTRGWTQWTCWSQLAAGEVQMGTSWPAAGEAEAAGPSGQM